MSHGSVGSLTLGTATLGEGQLDTYKEQLRAWGDALSEDGDILLYGCNVAAGRAGVAFVDSLSASTRADVAAATHTVGSAALGGDQTELERSGGLARVLPDWSLGPFPVHVVTESRGLPARARASVDSLMMRLAKGWPGPAFTR
ncbi:hypothetical protein G6F40_016520 [Rhizopus arrhizus]|nr:hypothetical protein G6F40_016520 [Rhizopus arrhizus]